MKLRQCVVCAGCSGPSPECACWSTACLRLPARVDPALPCWAVRRSGTTPREPRQRRRPMLEPPPQPATHAAERIAQTHQRSHFQSSCRSCTCLPRGDPWLLCCAVTCGRGRSENESRRRFCLRAAATTQTVGRGRGRDRQARVYSKDTLRLLYAAAALCSKRTVGGWVGGDQGEGAGADGAREGRWPPKSTTADRVQTAQTDTRTTCTVAYE